jgi:hypothetical protein
MAQIYVTWTIEAMHRSGRQWLEVTGKVRLYCKAGLCSGKRLISHDCSRCKNNQDAHMRVDNNEETV